MKPEEENKQIEELLGAFEILAGSTTVNDLNDFFDGLYSGASKTYGECTIKELITLYRFNLMMEQNKLSKEQQKDLTTLFATWKGAKQLMADNKKLPALTVKLEKTCSDINELFNDTPIEGKINIASYITEEVKSSESNFDEEHYGKIKNYLKEIKSSRK